MNDTKNQATQAALLSAFVVPGAGQIYNRQYGKGLCLAVLFLAASLGCLIPVTIVVIRYYAAISSADIENLENIFEPLTGMLTSLIVLFIASIVIYVYSIIDAYRAATRQPKPSSN